MLFGKKSEKILVVGLGNPGENYAATRHNVGFRAVEKLLPHLENARRQEKFSGEIFSGKLFGKDVLLVRPQTFMNSSGQCVGQIAKFYKIPPEKIYVIFDDISLSPGKLRLRTKGSAGGHNGIKSVIAYLGSENFIHVKIGVGDKPHPEYDLVDWVLGTPEGEEKIAIDGVLDTMPQVFRSFMTEPIDRTLNQFSH